MSISEQPATEQAHGERPGWPILQQPLGFVVYLGLLVFAVLFLIGVAAALTTLTTSDVVTFAALTLCAAVSVEGVRRLGRPRGLSHDLLGAWWFPVVVLLPPVYALLVPIPVFVLLQCRVRRARVHRRVFNACSVALCGFLASVLWHGVHAGDPIAGLGGAAGSAASLLTVGGVLLAVACCLAFTGLNTVLIAVAARITHGPERVRNTNADREAVMVDAVELCVGITVAIMAQLSLLLLVIALPPILLLQRSLLYHQLRAAARTDPKTGLLNAPTWEQAAVNAIARARSTRGRAAVLIIDIDHFKRVNDNHGHLFGDQVLLGVATTIAQELRQSDLLGRFGGEEFVVLLPGADVGEASRAAERLRARVGGMEIAVDDVPVAITVSVGLAVSGEHGNDLVELLTAADLALYRAKETGRNRVCLPAGRPGAGGAQGHGGDPVGGLGGGHDVEGHAPQPPERSARAGSAGGPQARPTPLEQHSSVGAGGWTGSPEHKGAPGAVDSDGAGAGSDWACAQSPAPVELRGVRTCPEACAERWPAPVGDTGSGARAVVAAHPAAGEPSTAHHVSVPCAETVVSTANRTAMGRATGRGEGDPRPAGRVPGPREGRVPEAVVAEVDADEDAVAGAAPGGTRHEAGHHVWAASGTASGTAADNGFGGCEVSGTAPVSAPRTGSSGKPSAGPSGDLSGDTSGVPAGEIP